MSVVRCRVEKMWEYRMRNVEIKMAESIIDAVCGSFKYGEKNVCAREGRTNGHTKGASLGIYRIGKFVNRECMYPWAYRMRMVENV